jgi:hypothetical protein
MRSRDWPLHQQKAGPEGGRVDVLVLDDRAPGDRQQRGGECAQAEMPFEGIVNGGDIDGGEDGKQRDFVGFEIVKGVDVGDVHQSVLHRAGQQQARGVRRTKRAQTEKRCKYGECDG